MIDSVSRCICSVVIFIAVACLSVDASAAANTGASGQSKNYRENYFPGGKTVRVGVSHNPPVGIHGNGGPPQGFVIDIIRDVAKAEKWNLIYIEKSWPELLKLLDTGKIDLLGGIAITPERAKKYNFSSQTATSNWAVVYRSKNTTINGIGDLAGKRVAEIPNSAHAVALEKISKSFEFDFIKVPATSYEQALELVDSGKADVAIIARAFHVINGPKYDAIATSVDFNPVELRFAAPKGTGKRLLAALDKYISTQKNDPTSRFSQLSAKWFHGPDNKPIPEWYYWAFGGTLILLGAAWLIVVWLRKEVDVRTGELKRSEKRFRDFSNSTSDWYWEMDKDLRFSFLSDRFTEVTGVAQRDLLGKTRAQSSLDFEERQLSRNMADLEAHRPFKDFEHSRVRADGGVVHLSVAGTPVFDGNGAFEGYRGTGADITERKILEEKLRQSQRMEAVGQLTGGVAHDFNNLLGVIIGNAEVLQGITKNDDKIRHNVESIIAAAERGAALTQRLLAFSRQQTLAPKSVAINGLIVGLEDMLQRSLGETIELHTSLGPGNCAALFDVNQFENALINLAINSRDAMPNGGELMIETAEVTLDESYAAHHDEVSPGRYVKVSVSDTGDGISPETLKKVFEPFFTTKEVGEGSGLGLSMVYGFAKQSGGHIAIYSELGRGTSVNLFLPSSIEAESSEKVLDDKPDSTDGSERILLVEDDEDLRKVPARFLDNAGYRVVEAKNSEEAIHHMLNEEAFDMLFTDVVLPGGMNGVEIAERAKLLQPNIKILFTTGYAENAIVHNGTLDPGVEVITKPYRRAELLEKIRKILDDV